MGDLLLNGSDCDGICNTLSQSGRGDAGARTRLLLVRL
jgi:hypothetical protein